MKSNDSAAAHQKVLKKAASPLVETFGISWGLASTMIFFVVVALAATIFWSIRSAPPRMIIITAGPPGSVFETYALKYMTNLQKNVGIRLEILPSNGSSQNLHQLNNPKVKVDVGFVEGGITNSTSSNNLVSLGSMYNMPLLVFYRSPKPIELLSDFKGKRLAIEPRGSGTRKLAMALLQLSGINTNGPTQLLTWEADAAADALMTNGVDAVFITGDSASPALMRHLIHEPGIRLMNFAEAEAYSRRVNYLTRMDVPRGAFDFTNDIPDHDIQLVGTTVELIARARLHPALIDQLLDVATQIHGGSSLFRRQGEFPALVKHDFDISPEAQRYQKNGKTWLYKHLPFWLAAIVDLLVPYASMLIVVIPGLRMIITGYKWRVKMIFYRWYRAIMALERRMAAEPVTPQRQRAILAELDTIETNVRKMRVPASLANDFYTLKGHIDFVRARLSGFGEEEPAQA